MDLPIGNDQVKIFGWLVKIDNFVVFLSNNRTHYEECFLKYCDYLFEIQL